MLLWTLLGLALSGAVVVGAGTVLARSGDVIAARTRLGGLWIGTLFLATATSLPELTTDIAAVRMDLPDLAAGDLFGSSMANMLILALVSLGPGAELFRKAALENALVIALAMMLTAVAAIGLFMGPQGAVFGLGPTSLVIGAGYLFGLRLIFRQSALAWEAGRAEEMGPPVKELAGGADTRATLRRAAAAFLGGAAVILVAAPVFASSAGRLAELSGLHVSFLGTWLVGFSTSLPELVTSLAAVRLRSYDLAVANLFGSNAFNMVLLIPLDLVHGSGPFLAAVDPVHGLSALVALVLMSLGLAAVASRAQGRATLAEPSGAIMVLVYLVGLVLILLRSGG
jgi:cation:H+ antiporter